MNIIIYITYNSPRLDTTERSILCLILLKSIRFVSQSFSMVRSLLGTELTRTSGLVSRSTKQMVVLWARVSL